MVNSRKIAVEIVALVFEKGAYSNIVLGAELNKANLDPKDKALVTEIVYGTLKYKYTIDIILDAFIKTGVKKLKPVLQNILRTAIYQMRYLSKIPDFAVVNEAVELTKQYKMIGEAKLVNGVLRNYLRNKGKDYCPVGDVVKSLSFQYSFEPWMVKLFIEQYGEGTAERILKGLNETPAVTVRVNSLKTNYEEAIKSLEGHEYIVQEGRVCPEAISISKGRSIENNPLFLEGHITVQDESAMLVAPSMDIVQELTVYDLCSAPGGKCTHIAELMNNTGSIYAFDIHENKLPLIQKNAARLGITNIHYGVLDAAIFSEKLENGADRVLIDVPCSGLGIIRKKPEIKWTKTKKDLKNILGIQRKIMQNAANYVKENGLLLYSTCTLNKDENENQVKWFLEHHPHYALEQLFYGDIENMLYQDGGVVTILPSESMDGFFIAKLRRKR